MHSQLRPCGKKWEGLMKKWNRPVISEIQVGMEINLYVCAKL